MLDNEAPTAHPLVVTDRTPSPTRGVSESTDPHVEPHLVARIQSGDVVAFESVFRAYAAELATLAYSYLKSRDDAEDVVQTLFVWLWANRHAFNPGHGVRAYLFGAVRNRALNVLRDRNTQSNALEIFSGNEPSEVPPPDAELLAADLHRVVEQTVAAMPTRCREVFTLVRTSALSYAEVARILGIAPKTVEIHMSRALAILRTRLGPHFER